MTKHNSIIAMHCIDMADTTVPCRIAYFGFDSANENIRRRMTAFANAGAQATGYMMRRKEPTTTEWTNIDLGITKDRAFVHRLLSVARALPTVYKNRKNIANDDLLWARNLEMLLLAWLTKAITRSKADLVYEVLDVHAILYTDNLKGKIARAAERFLLRRITSLVVSSPGFLRDYFTSWQQYTGRAVVWENRMLLNDAPEQTSNPSHPLRVIPPLRIGYVGGLRCSTSLQILLNTAQTLGPKVEVHLHGYFSILIPEELRQAVLNTENIHWHGSYKHPDDIQEIYHQLDVIWAGDLSDGLNSSALLPNRIYEGSYFGAIPIAPAASEVGRWVDKMGFGFTVDNPLQDNLIKLIDELTQETLLTKRNSLLDTDKSVFLESNSTAIQILQKILTTDGSVHALDIVV